MLHFFAGFGGGLGGTAHIGVIEVGQTVGLAAGLAIGTLAGPFASRTGGAHELEHAFDASGSLSVTRSELRSVRCLAWMPRRRATPHRAMAASSVGQAISRKLALPGSDRKPRAMKAPRHAALIWAMDPLTTSDGSPRTCCLRRSTSPVCKAKATTLRVTSTT